MSFPAFQLPPNTSSQTDLEASNKKPIYVAVAVGFILATGAVTLRGVARRKTKATFGSDDYTIVFALILLYALDISTILSAAKYGLGRHLPAVLFLEVPFQKVSLINIVLWQATAAATKASLLLLYYRLFSPSKRFRLAVRIAAAIVFGQWFVFTLLTIFQCRPVAAFWDRTIPGATCVNLHSFTVASGVFNLLTDILILCLPIRMVWSLNTTKAQKVTLTGIFLLGIFVCAISVVRISKLAVMKYGNLAVIMNEDPTWRLVDVYVWTTLEDSVGIASACLPTMRPLFDLPSTSRAESSNRKDSRRSSQRPAKAHFDRLYEESEPGVALQPLAKGKEGARTSPNIVASNEVMDKAPTKPLHSVNSTSRREDQYYPNRSTRRGSYE